MKSGVPKRWLRKHVEIIFASGTRQKQSGTLLGSTCNGQYVHLQDVRAPTQLECGDVITCVEAQKEAVEEMFQKVAWLSSGKSDSKAQAQAAEELKKQHHDHAVLIDRLLVRVTVDKIFKEFSWNTGARDLAVEQEAHNLGQRNQNLRTLFKEFVAKAVSAQFKASKETFDTGMKEIDNKMKTLGADKKEENPFADQARFRRSCFTADLQGLRASAESIGAEDLAGEIGMELFRTFCEGNGFDNFETDETVELAAAYHYDQAQEEQKKAQEEQKKELLAAAGPPKGKSVRTQ